MAVEYLDEVLNEVDTTGLYQLFLYFVIAVGFFFTAASGLSYYFTASDLVYRCFVPECELSPINAVYNTSWMTYAVPAQKHCFKYEVFNDTAACTADMFSNVSIRCDQWVYEGRENTIVREWDLTCEENQWKIALVGTMNSLGQLVGMPIAGYLSDRFGRKKSLTVLTFISCILGVGRSFSNDYLLFVCLEFVNMMVGWNVLSTFLYIMGVESMSGNKRVFAGAIFCMFDSIGESLLGLVAWGLQDWRLILRVLNGSGFIVLILIQFLPESIRWLVAQGRHKEACKIIKLMARVNKITLSQDKIALMQEAIKQEKKDLHGISNIAYISNEGGSYKVKSDEDTNISSVQNGHKCYNSIDVCQSNSKSALVDISSDKASGVQTNDEIFKQVLQSRTLLIRLANCSFCWATNTFVYYGLSLNSFSLAGSKYFTYSIVSLTAAPGYFLCYFIMNSPFGRVRSLSWPLIFSGICCFVFMTVPAHLSVVSLVLYLLGKFAVTISFGVVYMFTAEMFPTPLRQTMLGICSMFGRIGTVVAPQTPQLMQYYEGFPLILFGSFAIISGCLVYFFPETHGKPLPDTVKEAEDIGKV